jgi:hypothetical protein
MQSVIVPTTTTINYEFGSYVNDNFRAQLKLNRLTARKNKAINFLSKMNREILES